MLSSHTLRFLAEALFASGSLRGTYEVDDSHLIGYTRHRYGVKRRYLWRKGQYARH